MHKIRRAGFEPTASEHESDELPITPPPGHAISYI